LKVINPTAAGIDVSDTEMMVAYPISPEQLEIRVFGCFNQGSTFNCQLSERKWHYHHSHGEHRSLLDPVVSFVAGIWF